MVLYNNLEKNERGVSESIGFMLIFTLIIVGIGLVTLYGYPLLLKQQVNADEKIMEKNMIVLQNDVKSLAYKTVPFKETSLKIGGGSLMLFNSSYSPASSTITIRDSGGNIYVDSFHSGDLMYSSDAAGTDISLQNGAVVMRRHAEPGSVMLAQPRWFYDGPTNTMVINLVNITSEDIMGRTGIGTVQMALGEVNYTKIDIPVGGHFYLDYTPDPTPDGQNYLVAWDNYFRNSMKMTPTATVNEYQLPTIDTKPATLVIKNYEVFIKSL